MPAPTPAPIRVSNHALQRWCERTGLINFETMRAMLEQSLHRAASAAASLGHTRFNILADGLVYVVEDGIVVTVLVDDGRNKGRMLENRHGAA